MGIEPHGPRQLQVPLPACVHVCALHIYPYIHHHELTGREDFLLFQLTRDLPGPFRGPRHSSEHCFHWNSKMTKRETTAMAPSGKQG